MFITFEGAEGCGKSTQVNLLREYLLAKGQNVIVTQEPGGTNLGKELRQILLNPETILDKTTEIYLFAADRSDHVKKIIQPALAEGNIVVSDRYIDSTIAYQVGGRGLPEDFVRYINMVSSHGVIPDLTILLDVSPEVGIKRARARGEVDRFEKEAIAFHHRVRQAYLTIAQNEAKRVRLVNANEAGIDDVFREIKEVVEEYL
ncbi:MAG: dTMP kinase [bacterium]|nr:dTMP kinase [Candidatus Margulisiibacteriota bacterium]